MNITKENYKTMKAFCEALAKEIQEFETPAEKADNWPMTVDDVEKGKFWIDGNDIKAIAKDTDFNYDKSDFATESDAKSALAFAQLSRLIRHINNGWEPTGNMFRHTVCVSSGHLIVDSCDHTYFYPKCLCFRGDKDAFRSIETHRQLWMDYFQVEK